MSNYEETVVMMNSPRGQLIISQALVLAIESIEARPKKRQEPSNVSDMKRLLTLFPLYKVVQQAEENWEELHKKLQSDTILRKRKRSELKKYSRWINQNLGGLSDVELSCQCTPVCVRMKQMFPELIIMSGEVTTDDGRVYEHTWLQTEDGLNIIDPTERQFPSVVAEYNATICDNTDPAVAGLGPAEEPRDA